MFEHEEVHPSCCSSVLMIRVVKMFFLQDEADYGYGDDVEEDAPHDTRQIQCYVVERTLH